MRAFIGYIYVVENLVNGKIYVGQSTQPDKRKYAHFSTGVASASITNSAVKKYGKENFDFVLLERCNSKEELDAREEYWIENLNSLAENGRGYNRTPNACGGNKGMLGKRHSPEARKKMSKGRKGKKHTEEWKDNMSKRVRGEGHHFFGQKFSQEHRQKLSESHKGHVPSKETREKKSKMFSGKNNPFYGKKHTPETREKMKKARAKQKVVITAETRRKMVETRKKRGWYKKFREGE